MRSPTLLRLGAFAVLSVALAAPPRPAAAGSTHHSWTIEKDDGPGQRTISIKDDDVEIEFKTRGQVELRPDLSGFSTLGRNATVEVRHTSKGVTHRLAVASGSDGRAEYRWWVNGNSQPWNDASRRWLADFLLELDRRTAFAVEARFPALWKAGGAAAVLDEVDRMSGDYAKGAYLRKLVATPRLDTGSRRKALEVAGRSVKSDHELGRVLTEYATAQGLADDVARDAWIAAAGTLESDYECAKVLMSPIESGRLSRDEATTVLKLVDGIDSDYEAARVLIAMANARMVTGPLLPNWLEALHSVESDYEQSRTLIALLDVGSVRDDDLAPVIESAASIDSDYEAARVLIHLAGRTDLEGELLDRYRKAAQGISSEYERKRVLAAIHD